MKVRMYAALKDYFDKELEINEPVRSIDELNTILLQLNPQSIDIMPVCRFAVNDEFVDKSFLLEPNDSIHIIPPSSGG